MADPGFRARLTQVRAATQVDYAAVASLKMPVLQAAFERFRTEHLARHTARAAACRAFLRERGEPMRLHTLFDAIDGYLRRHHGTGAGWHNWPEEYRSSGRRRGAALRARTRRRRGFPWLPAMARGRAVRRRAPAGARAGLERRHLRRLRRGRERLGFGDLVRSDRCTARAPPSARRPIRSGSAARSGAFRRRIRGNCGARRTRRSWRWCAPACATAARCASITSWRCSASGGCRAASSPPTAATCTIHSRTC